MKVCVDAGHGGRDPGAIGWEPFLYKERDFTLAVALLLEDELEERGHEAVLVRRTDRTVGLAARAAFANRYDADLFVSIHANAAASVAAEGIEVYHFPGSEGGRIYARQILESLMNAFPDHTNRGVKEANFAVLRLTRMPAVLVEYEFITHPDQLVFLADASNQKEMARAVARAISDAHDEPRPV